MTDVQQPPTQQPPQPQLKRHVPAPGSGLAVALIIIGVLLFIGGWAFLAMAPSLSTVDSLLDDNIVNTPSVVQKSAGGVMFAVIGAVLFVGGLLMMRLEDWAVWLHKTRAPSGN